MPVPQKKVAVKVPIKTAAIKKTTFKGTNPFKGPKTSTPGPANLSGREILHPRIILTLCQGEDALTCEQAKEIIGWEAETDANPFKTEYTLVDMYGKKVRLHNNPSNRPFTKSLCRSWMVEHLKRRWELNGENLIIGKTGITISAQHRLAGFILACQEWNLNRDKYPWWEVEPTFETTICYGIDESDKVINTIGTGKPQSVTDVLFRSKYFSNIKGTKERKLISRMADFAVRMLWYRTGANNNAFGIGTSKRSHSDTCDFIERHDRLLECVKHIYDENVSTESGPGKLAPYGYPGYAAAMLYLMGSSETNPKEYRQSERPDESMLDWSNWEKALAFWSDSAANLKPMKLLRDTLLRTDVEGGSLDWKEKLALIAKAWQVIVAEEKLVDPKQLKLTYTVDADSGVPLLSECPTVGGIDAGNPSDVGDSVERSVPTPAEIAERKAAEKDIRTNKVSQDREPLIIGGQVFVEEPGSEGDWYGELVSQYDTPKGKMCRIKQKRTGRVFEAHVNHVTNVKE